MRLRVARLLHVLLCAPAAAIVAVSPALSVHAQAAAAGAAPRPYTVVLDAGHGGSPDNAHPEKPYDPGAVGVNGLLEKDLALDMVLRVKPLLEAQGAQVVLTRSTDVSMDITSRMQRALDVGADLFVSIHLNGWTDPAAAGSLVLYPKDFCADFARTMSRALTARLGPEGVLPDGVQFRPEMFQQAAMPTVTLEPLFLTNPTEAALIARPAVRDAIAHAVVDGVDTQAGGQIAARRALAAQWAVVSRVFGGSGSAAVAAPPAAVAVVPAGTAAPTPVPDSIEPAGAAVPGRPAAPVGVGGAGHSDGAAVPGVVGATAAGAGPGPGPGGVTTASAASPGLPLAPLAAGIVGLGLVLLLRRPLLHGGARVAAAMVAGIAWLEGGEVPAIARFDSRTRRRQERRRALLERSRARGGAGPAARAPAYDELFFRPRPRGRR